MPYIYRFKFTNYISWFLLCSFFNWGCQKHLLGWLGWWMGGRSTPFLRVLPNKFSISSNIWQFHAVSMENDDVHCVHWFSTECWSLEPLERSNTQRPPGAVRKASKESPLKQRPVEEIGLVNSSRLSTGIWAKRPPPQYLSGIEPCTFGFVWTLEVPHWFVFFPWSDGHPFGDSPRCWTNPISKRKIPDVSW